MQNRGYNPGLIPELGGFWLGAGNSLYMAPQYPCQNKKVNHLEYVIGSVIALLVVLSAYVLGIDGLLYRLRI